MVVGLAVWLAAPPSRAQTPEATAGSKAPGALALTPTAFVQVDLRGFPGWDLDPDDTRLRRETFEFRRVRAGVDGSWRTLRFEVSVDPVEWNEPPIQDAWVEWRLASAVRLRGGQFKLPGGREYGTSSRRLGFLERSPLSESLAAGRDTGMQVDLRVGQRWHAEAGIFLGDGRGREHRGETTVASRVQWRPAARLEVAGYGTVGHAGGGAGDHRSQRAERARDVELSLLRSRRTSTVGGRASAAMWNGARAIGGPPPKRCGSQTSASGRAWTAARCRRCEASA